MTQRRNSCGCRVVVTKHNLVRIEFCGRHEELRQRRILDFAAREVEKREQHGESGRVEQAPEV